MSITCAQPGCGGTVADGYCERCGLAPAAGTSAPTGGTPPSGAPGATAPAAVAPGAVAPGTMPAGTQPTTPPRTPGAPAAVSSTGSPSSTPVTRATGSLASVAMGSARATSGSRPTRRLGSGRRADSRLGAGLTSVPSAPKVDPVAILMNPAQVAEHKRFCSSCNTPVGRSRDGQPGRTKGFCPSCGSRFDFDPRLSTGMLVGGQYEVAGCLAHGGMGWIYLARDRNVNDRWVVLKGLLNTADVEASRAAVTEKQYLAEVEHPLIVEIYNFVTGPDGASYIVMEFVGGRSLNDLLKQRMKDNNGVFNAVPVDQAIAFVIEILPAFSYLHGLGLLYCDFKPANVIQVGDAVKLIDLGGVRRVDDDTSAIYGTVGFQAPEVPADGCSVPSDIYTVARTLAVLIFEFSGYQNTWVDSLPGPDQVEVFARYDSLFRLLERGSSTQPEDRFQSADELREQLLGVLREVIALDAPATSAVTRSTVSAHFEAPSIVSNSLNATDLPAMKIDSSDASAAWLAGLVEMEPEQRRVALASAPERTTAVVLAEALLHVELIDVASATRLINELLAHDAWDWRAVWAQGLLALQRNEPAEAVRAFNAVYGQLPGELAPKLALARACELAGDFDVAERLYAVCARCDANYVAAAQFGLARVSEALGRNDDALAALSRIPTTSRAWVPGQRRRVELLNSESATVAQLDQAATELEQFPIDPREKLVLRTALLRHGFAALSSGKITNSGPATIGGVSVTDNGLRSAIEKSLRDTARLTENERERVALVDEANRIRPRTWL
jgi:serine/threonine-protein kinase PknG